MGDYDWAEELVGKNVVHLGTQVVGVVARFHDGVTSLARSSLTGESVLGPVVEMADGATFVAKREEFRALTDVERQLYAAVAHFVADVARECARMSAMMRVGPDLAVPLIASALRAQARLIERARPQAGPEVPA